MHNRAQQAIQQLREVVQQIASAAGHVSVAASEIIDTGDASSVQKGARAAVQCANATQRLSMVTAAMSEISHGLIPSHNSMLAITQSAHPLADASTPAPGESLAGSARSLWSDMAIEAASSATEEPEKDTDPFVPVKPVELAKPVESAKPVAPSKAAVTAKPVEVSKPADRFQQNMTASATAAAPMPAQLPSGSARQVESRPSQPARHVESEKGALLAKEADLRAQIDNLISATPHRPTNQPAKPSEADLREEINSWMPATPAGTTWVSAKPNEGGNSNETPTSAPLERPAEAMKPAGQPSPTQQAKPSEQAKALIAAKIAALRKKAEESRAAQPSSLNGPTSPVMPQRQAELAKPTQVAQLVDQPRPIEPANAIERPKPARQTYQTRPVEQLKPIEQPKPNQQSRIIDQSRPVRPSQPFQIPRRYEVPQQADQSRGPAPPNLHALRDPRENSWPAAPPKPAERDRSYEPNGLNRQRNSTAPGTPVEPTWPANVRNEIEPLRSAQFQRPNERPDKPYQPASQPANFTAKPLADRMIHPNWETRFGPDLTHSQAASPQVNGPRFSGPIRVSIPTGPKRRRDTVTQSGPTQQDGNNNNSKPTNLNPTSAPPNDPITATSCNARIDLICRTCFEKWNGSIRTADRLPPCKFGSNYQRTKCDYCYDQRRECVLVRGATTSSQPLRLNPGPLTTYLFRSQLKDQTA